MDVNCIVVDLDDLQHDLTADFSEITFGAEASSSMRFFRLIVANVDGGNAFIQPQHRIILKFEKDGVWHEFWGIVFEVYPDIKKIIIEGYDFLGFFIRNTISATWSEVPTKQVLMELISGTGMILETDLTSNEFPFTLTTELMPKIKILYQLEKLSGRKARTEQNKLIFEKDETVTEVNPLFEEGDNISSSNVEISWEGIGNIVRVVGANLHEPSLYMGGFGMMSICLDSMGYPWVSGDNLGSSYVQGGQHKDILVLGGTKAQKIIACGGFLYIACDDFLYRVDEVSLVTEVVLDTSVFDDTGPEIEALTGAGSEVFVASGYGTVLYSSNQGITWTMRSVL